jgi:hypothetical protein
VSRIKDYASPRIGGYRNHPTNRGVHRSTAGNRQTLTQQPGGTLQFRSPSVLGSRVVMGPSVRGSGNSIRIRRWVLDPATASPVSANSLRSASGAARLGVRRWSTAGVVENGAGCSRRVGLPGSPLWNLRGCPRVKTACGAPASAHTVRAREPTSRIGAVAQSTLLRPLRFPNGSS